MFTFQITEFNAVAYRVSHRRRSFIATGPALTSATVANRASQQLRRPTARAVVTAVQRVSADFGSTDMHKTIKEPPRITFDGAQENVVAAAAWARGPGGFPARVAVMQCVAIAARRAGTPTLRLFYRPMIHIKGCRAQTLRLKRGLPVDPTGPIRARSMQPE